MYIKIASEDSEVNSFVSLWLLLGYFLKFST